MKILRATQMLGIHEIHSMIVIINVTNLQYGKIGITQQIMKNSNFSLDDDC